MKKFRTYLETATALAKSGNLNKDGHPALKLIIGNTSCDMDSAIGAITLAYFYTKTKDSLWVPVINCDAADFYCKPEIVKHLKDSKIDHSHLVFLDELKALYPNRDEITEIGLVDHN
jgi:exopolyphosphatase